MDICAVERSHSNPFQQEPRTANYLSLVPVSYATLPWKGMHILASNITPGSQAHRMFSPSVENTLLLTLINYYRAALIQHRLSCTASLS